MNQLWRAGLIVAGALALLDCAEETETYHCQCWCYSELQAGNHDHETTFDDTVPKDDSASACFDRFTCPRGEADERCTKDD